MKINPYPPKVLPPPKYKLGTKFRNLDTEIEYELIEVRQDTYILKSLATGLKYHLPNIGESEFTLEYDYEIVPT